MARPRFIVGIDLGTTNCAVAYVDTKGRERPTSDIRAFEVPQLVAPGEPAARPMLPSFLYLPGAHELPPGSDRLPWADAPGRIVGEFARVQGARVPSRLVSSAKSWLCHGGVDREAGILPWGAPKEVARVSPVAASAAYLGHIRDAWNHRFAQADPTARLEVQDVVLTVPASFDEAARELTLAAARLTGLEHITLLEEPQAAFYCWIVTHQERWQSQVRAGELILVCDVGGGTTDFSLITVVESPTGPGFRRVAVGDHLMLGGDNIDLALAHRVEARLGGARLDAEQWSALRFACRTAKEKLLADVEPPARWPVVVAGRGSRLIGGGHQSELTHDEVIDAVIDGFLPFTPRGVEPEKSSKLGLQEFGLPFVADPAITRHLAGFLRRHRAEAAGPEAFDPAAIARPDAILFNGGALTPSRVRDRIVAVVRSWFAEESGGSYTPRVLSNDSLDLAVAHGAAYYGVVRRGGGIRIGGGTARSFYVGLERPDPSAPPWLCVVPRDAQEGDTVAVEGHDLELRLGEPVAFPLASSSVRPQDRPGDLAPRDPDSIRDLPPLVGLMKTGRKAKADRVGVQLTARVTEVGTVELWCASRIDDRRWRLQIQLRGPSGAAGSSGPGGALASIVGQAEADAAVLEQKVVDAACDAVRAAFAAARAQDDPGPARLIKKLEEVLELPRDQWPPSALRALWEPLRDVAERRKVSPQHEARWLNLAGYCLRPGTGYPLDEARIKALWPVFHAGLDHVKDTQCWVEWWVLWRRVAAGLNRSHHDEIYRRLQPYLAGAKSGLSAAPPVPSGRKPSRPKPEPHELAEMARCAASLERLSAATKEMLGKALVMVLVNPTPTPHLSWCLGRVGARVPLYGPADTVVPPDVASEFLKALLSLPEPSSRERADRVFALASLARVSGDRARDIDEALRARVLDRMAALGADEATLDPVREYRELGASQQGLALGDSLPTGLRLVAATADGA